MAIGFIESVKQQMPQDWILDKIKHQVVDKPYSIVDGPFGTQLHNDEYVDDGVPVIRIVNLSYDGNFDPDKLVFITEEKYQTLKRSSVQSGDLIIAKTGATIGKVGVFEGYNKGVIASSCLKISLNEDISSNFFKYYLISDYCQQQIILTSSGSTRDTINMEQIANLQLVLPPDMDTQHQIANYLDKQTAKIDATISRNEELIQLLEEKRVALINQVVTKGLNPDVPMKDSGVEWIGEIPEHWEIKRLKYNCYVNPSDKKSVSDEDLKINFLPMEKVSEDGWYDLESMAQYSSISKGYTYFEDDDVLVAKITPCFENGKSALLKDLKYGFGFGSTEFHVLRFKEHILPEFIYYIIKSYAFRTIGQAFMHGTAGQKRVGTDFIENYLMVTPPIEEQKEIIEYLDEEITKLTLSISKIQENIALLEEYKTSLIHHVVTGKIDVRGEDI